MYQTNSTNKIGSGIQAKSFACSQLDLWENESQTHNPDQLMTDQIFEHYHQTLKAQPWLIKMLIRRKINPDYINQFRIGFADRTLGFELQSPKCRLGSQNRGHLQRLGLLKASGHEFFRGSMVFPYPNHEGHISGAYGRRPRHQRRSPAYHLYWNSQQVSFFNATQRLPKSLILCKSALDALTLLTAGAENVVATMGVQGFSEIQLSRLLEDGVRCVFIAFDNSPTADRYALLIAQALDATGIACFRIKLPLGQDVNRFAMGQVNVTDAFNKKIDAAVPLKQCYGELVPPVKEFWISQLVSIEDCVAFYLEEQRQAQKTFRTLSSARIHLERFQEYCHSRGIDQIAKLNSAMLEGYQCYLNSEKNVFSGKVISTTTQMERMDAVSRMLSRLHHYDIIPEPLTFVTYSGPIH